MAMVCSQYSTLPAGLQRFQRGVAAPAQAASERRGDALVVMPGGGVVVVDVKVVHAPAASYRRGRGPAVGSAKVSGWAAAKGEKGKVDAAAALCRGNERVYHQGSFAIARAHGRSFVAGADVPSEDP